MTEQPSFTAAQNIAVLTKLLRSADVDGIANFSFFYESAADADLPYNQIGKESGFIAQVRNEETVLEKYAVAYQPIRNGTEAETFITYYDANGCEISIYRMPPSRVFLESDQTFLSRRAEFLVWCKDNPNNFAEERTRSRCYLVEINRRGLHISPEQLR